MTSPTSRAQWVCAAGRPVNLSGGKMFFDIVCLVVVLAGLVGMVCALERAGWTAWRGR